MASKWVILRARDRKLQTYRAQTQLGRTINSGGRGNWAAATCLFMWPTATIAPRRQQPNDNNRQHRQLLIQSKHRSFPSLFCASGFSHEYTHGHERWTQIKMKKKNDVRLELKARAWYSRTMSTSFDKVVRWRCAGYLPFLAFSSVEWFFFVGHWSLGVCLLVQSELIYSLSFSPVAFRFVYLIITGHACQRSVAYILLIVRVSLDSIGSGYFCLIIFSLYIFQ